MTYCRKCGKELADGSKFCNDCGTKVEESTNSVYQYYDSYDQAEQAQTGSKRPTCGRVGLGLMIVSFVVLLIMGLLVAITGISSKILAFATAPVLILAVLAALVLAIVSIARKEQKHSAILTFAFLGGFLIIAIIAKALK